MTTTETEQSTKMRPKDFDYFCLFCDEPFNTEPKAQGQKVTDADALQIAFSQSYGRQLRSIFDDRLNRYERILPLLKARFVKAYEDRINEEISSLARRGYDADEAAVEADRTVAREMVGCNPKSVEELAGYYQTAHAHLTFARLEDFCNTVQVEPTGPKAHAGCFSKNFKQNVHQQRNMQMFGFMSAPALEIMDALEDSPTFGWYSRAFRKQYDLLEDRIVTMKITTNCTGH